MTSTRTPARYRAGDRVTRGRIRLRSPAVARDEAGTAAAEPASRRRKARRATRRPPPKKAAEPAVGAGRRCSRCLALRHARDRGATTSSLLPGGDAENRYLLIGLVLIIGGLHRRHLSTAEPPADVQP